MRGAEALKGHGTAAVWDANSGRELARLEGDGTGVTAAAWNWDESQVMITTEDGIFLYWVGEALLAAGCARVWRNLTWPEWQFYLGDEPYHCTCSNLPMHPTVLEAEGALIAGAPMCAADGS